MAAEEDAELKELVIQTLENNGVLAQIRAKLRASVFLALENTSEEQLKKSVVNDEFQHLMTSDTGKVVTSLVYDFLKHFKLDATLSVFESETQFSKLVPSEDFNSIRNALNSFSNNAQNNSLLSSLVKNNQLDKILKEEKISASDVPAKNSLLNVDVFKHENDTEQSSSSTVTDIKYFEEDKDDVVDNEGNSHSAHLQDALKNVEVNPKAPQSFGLSSLNNAPPLPGMKGTFSPSNSGNIKHKHSTSSKQSGENEDYEDDFNSSISLNSAIKSDFNNSMEDEIEENISGNVDDPFSGEAVTEDECVTSDRTVSHISTSGVDYCESVKE